MLCGQRYASVAGVSGILQRWINRLLRDWSLGKDYRTGIRGKTRPFGICRNAFPVFPLFGFQMDATGGETGRANSVGLREIGQKTRETKGFAVTFCQKNRLLS
jgi:hypothetical protein